MRIPKVTRTIVQHALQEIDRRGVPVNRRSTRFCLIHNGRHYPPKYFLALAVQHATGRSLKPGDHSGGAETNSRLRKLGFTVQACPQCHIMSSPWLQPGATAFAPAEATSRSSQPPCHRPPRARRRNQAPPGTTPPENVPELAQALRRRLPHHPGRLR